MTATLVILAPEHDRLAGRAIPTQLHNWTLDDAGPFELDGRGGLFVRVQCKCLRRKRYVSRKQWFEGTFPTKQCVVCDRARPRSKGEAAYVRRGPRVVLPYHREES